MIDPIDDPNFNPSGRRDANPERIAKIGTLASALRDFSNRAEICRRDLDKEIREAKAAGHSYTQLSEASGLSRSVVQRIVAET